MNKQTTVALSKFELAHALASHVRMLNDKIHQLRSDSLRGHSSIFHGPSLRQQAENLLAITMEEERRYQSLIDELFCGAKAANEVPGGQSPSVIKAWLR